MDKFACSRRLISITYRRCFWQFFNELPSNKFKLTYSYRLNVPKTRTESTLMILYPIPIFLPITKTDDTEEYTQIVYRDSCEDVKKYIESFEKNKWCLACNNISYCKEK